MNIEKIKYFQGQDSLPLAKYYAQANPSAVLELIERLETAEKQVGSLTEELNNRCIEQYQLQERLEAAERDAACWNWMLDNDSELGICISHDGFENCRYLHKAEVIERVKMAMKEKP